MKKFVLVCLLLSSSTACALDPLVRVDITVVGEEGKAVEEVSVRGDFAGVVSGSGTVDLESTNEDGIATVIGRSHFPVRVIAKKKNFYTTTMEVNTVEVVDGEQVYKDQKVRMVLREKRNPIPLYAKHYTGYIPVANKWLGFDLEKADWVSPYGRGVISDILFRYDGYNRSFWDAKGRLEMHFKNHSDGLVDVSAFVDKSSELKVPHTAPRSGYKNDETSWVISSDGKLNNVNRPSESKYYFLRVRSALDNDGAIEKANYVKVYHDFNFFFSDVEGAVAGIKFDYYFNPNANDRNLEFDVRQNLFTDLEYEERVFEP